MPRKQCMSERRRVGWPAAAFLAASLAWWTGCRQAPADSSPAVAEEAGAAETARPTVRKEFVILKELTNQYAIQSEAGNEARVETVERHLRERLAALDVEGANTEERAIAEAARKLVAKR